MSRAIPVAIGRTPVTMPDEKTRYFAKQSEIERPCKIAALSSSCGTPLSKH